VIFQVSSKSSKEFRRSCKDKAFYKEKKLRVNGAITPLKIIGQPPPPPPFMHIYTMRSFFVPSFIKSPKMFKRSCKNILAFFKEKAKPKDCNSFKIYWTGLPLQYAPPHCDLSLYHTS
jgi:hypothetical protein